MNSVKALAAALVGMLLVAGLASPASATSADVSGRDGVRYEGCRSYKYDYSIDTDGYPQWDADVVFEGPNGGTVASDILMNDLDRASGTSSVLICDDDPVGRYQILLDVTFYDEDYNEQGSASSADGFRLRKPHTRTSYTVDDPTPRYGQILTFRVVSKLEQPRGYRANTYADVVLEARRAGDWERLRGSRNVTNNRGVAAFKGRWERRAPLAIRAVTVRTPVFDTSASRAKTLG